MAEVHPGRALLAERCRQTQRRRLMKGLLFFPISALLIVMVGYGWQGGMDWIYAAVLAATGLYGFVNLMSGSRMTEFETSPIGQFLSNKSKKYVYEVLLIRHSDERTLAEDENYQAVISFIEKSGVKISVSFSGREVCRQVIGYLKESLTERCVIMDLSFEEFEENRREYLQTR